MSGKRFQARAKTVQKLGRDGLVEQNKATGEEKRVSQRTADISFGPARSQEQAAGHRAVQRGGGDPAAPAKKRRKQPRPVQQTAEEAVYAAQAPVSAPEVPVPDAPSMRMAVDAPMIAPAVTSEDAPPPPPVPRKRRNRNNRKKTKQRQAAKHTPDAARSPEDQPLRGTGDVPTQNRPPGPAPTKRPPRPVEGGGRLKLETSDNEKPVSDGEKSADAKAKTKRKQAQRLTPDAAQSAVTVEQVEQRHSRLVGDGGGRLQFEKAADDTVPTPAPATEPSSEKKRAAKKRRVMAHAVDATQSMDVQQAEPLTPAPVEDDLDTRQRDSPQQPEAAALEPELSVVPDDRSAYKKQQAAKFAAQSAATSPPKRERLQFEYSPPKTDSPQPKPETPEPSATPKDRTAHKKQQAVKFAAHSTAPSPPKRRRLQFEYSPPKTDSPQLKTKAPEPSAAPKDRTAYKKRQAAKFSAQSDVSVSSGQSKLQFEDTPPQTDSPKPESHAP